MFPSANTKDAKEVENELNEVFHCIFSGNKTFVSETMQWITRCFQGEHGNFQKIDVLYHDVEHTFQVALCMMYLLKGRAKSGAFPLLSEEMCTLGLLAVLLHDTGYLKTKDDVEGTGAKYTLTHVSRSCNFAETLLSAKGMGEKEIHSVQNMIHCTGVNVNLSSIPFQSREERIVGFILGTTDLLAQMAADNYLNKLPSLFEEFEESFHSTQETSSVAGRYASPEAMMQETPLFWENYVKPRINDDFEKCYLYLNDPYPDGPNEYIKRINNNVDILRLRFANA